MKSRCTAPFHFAAALAACSTLAACGSDDLADSYGAIAEADAAVSDDEKRADLESDGYELEAIEQLPALGAPEESVVDPQDVPDEVMTELREQIIDKAIVGADNRAIVRNSRVTPFKAVVQVLAQWKKGEAGIPCTGTMVAGDAVLTAAHCLYNSTRTANGFPYSVSVVPGLYPKSPLPASGVQYNTPFGVGYAKKLFVPDRFKSTDQDAWSRIPFDYAVIRLKAAIPNAGTRSFGVLEDLLSAPAVLDGYHEDKQDCLQMYESKDRVRKVLADGSFNHFTDLKPGASGGGIVGSGAWSNTIFGVQSSHIDEGNRYNIASTITESKYRSIKSWVTRVL